MKITEPSAYSALKLDSPRIRRAWATRGDYPSSDARSTNSVSPCSSSPD